ncbi:hypothetical protein FXV83_00770 [Bradyrhizobium hipponense]|uniref:Uncharacterized protein n=1 Tax=Bradyrhizobium hipponense TaxID=2605638 RepID=A0A5S4YXQ9_9BRAD|nr:hypothetical protein [Bradyrhizobium hipponense]TYO68397.1 hypothetical protein FXV83_00770 [Bradyrhizobium hipponense]
MIKPCGFAASIAIGILCALCVPSSYAAAYLLSSNAADAESRIVVDLQNKTLDTTNLAPEVPAKTLAALNGAPPLAKAVLQSALKKICPVLSVDNDYGRQYAFRSIHALGKIDWIVSASAASPETITSISFLLLNTGKPPAILPILPPGGETSILPSVEMGCSNEEERRAAEQEIKQACEELGGSCTLKVK